MNDLRARLEAHTDPDTVTAICRTIETAIHETARHQDDDGRALGMLDAADLIKDARINHDPDNVPGIRADDAQDA